MVAKGLLYWAPAFDAAGSTTKWPSLGAAYGDEAAWTSAGWTRILDTVNGIGGTFRNPRVAVNSEERGRLGQVASGDEGVTIACQFVSPTFELTKKISALESNDIAATSQVETLALTSGVTTNGAFTVTLNGTAYTVAGATTTSQGTATNLATYLRTASNYSPSLPTTGASGWTIGGTGSNVTYTAATSGARGGTYSLTPGTTGVAGTFTADTVGHGLVTMAHLDKAVDMGLALGFDGIAVAGSLFSGRRYIRGIAYHAENTSNTEHRWAHTALDAVFRPNASFEAQPAVDIPSASIANTGIPSVAVLDDNKRFDYAFIDAPEV